MSVRGTEVNSDNFVIYSNATRFKIISSFSFLVQEFPSELGRELSS